MRRILVTGGNKGIGLAIVTAILEEHDDTVVFLGSRDDSRGRGARDGLVDANPGWADRLEVLSIDVSRDESVTAAATKVANMSQQPNPLYAVVNNAGIGLGSASVKDVLDVNTLGVKRVCDSFLPLVDPDHGRIVNVTSAAGPNFVSRCSPERQREFVNPQADWLQLQALIDECLGLDSDDAFAAAGLGKRDAYGLSKALANAYTVMLARQHPNLRINACTPGFIETDLTRHYAVSQGKTPAEMGMKSPAEGARSAMFLLFGEPEGNGRYYGSDSKRSPLDRYRSPGDPPYTGD